MLSRILSNGFNPTIAMAEQLLQIGDQSTADIKLQLIGTDGGEHRTNPLYLHSQILKKSEFYATLLCKRWSSERRPIEMEITTFHSIEMYLKCIQLMYSSQSGNRFRYSSVDEALSILPIASELLFQNCVEECMRYLNAVRWSTKQEVRLRALLLSLEINILPDLATRLGITQWNSDYGGLQMLEYSLQKMLSTISSGSYNHSEYIEEYIAGFFEVNSSFAETCRSALLKEFSANIERAKSDKYAISTACSALLWILNMIQWCDGELFETVFNLFCKDAELPVALNRSCTGYSSTVSPYSGLKNPHLCLDPLFDLIDRFLDCLGTGKIVTSTSFRVSFLTNWVPISVVAVNLNGRNKLERGIIDVAETLPLVEQRRIYNVWKETLPKNPTETFKCWAKNVEDAILRHNIFFV
jgi:hypothetical protein